MLHSLVKSSNLFPATQACHWEQEKTFHGRSGQTPDKFHRFKASILHFVLMYVTLSPRYLAWTLIRLFS